MFINAVSRRLHLASVGRWRDAGREPYSTQLLKPVICSIPISANLYVGFRAHGRRARSATTNPRRCRAAIVSMLMRIAGCYLKWNKSTQRPIVLRHIERSRPLCGALSRVHTDQRGRILVFTGIRPTHGIIVKRAGLINEIREFRPMRSYGAAAIVVNTGQFTCCKRKADVNVLETS